MNEQTNDLSFLPCFVVRNWRWTSVYSSQAAGGGEGRETRERAASLTPGSAFFRRWDDYLAPAKLYPNARASAERSHRRASSVLGEGLDIETRARQSWKRTIDHGRSLAARALVTPR